MNATPAPYRFHAYDVSYFSSKVRPALRYKGLWVEERRANVREILRRTGLALIPILETPEGEVWQDSTEILERPERRQRTIGACEIQLRGTTLKKAAGSYTLWMVGRTLDAYRSLSDADRARVDRELAGTGWDERLAHEPRHRFVKDGFRLAFA